MLHCKLWFNEENTFVSCLSLKVAVGRGQGHRKVEIEFLLWVFGHYADYKFM